MATYKNCQQTNFLGLEILPSHWEVKKIKHLFSIGRGRVISQAELEDEGMYPVYSSQTHNNGRLGYINSYDFNCEQITWTTDGANAGTVFLRKGKHNCTNVCGTLQPINKKNLLQFHLYCLQYINKFHKRPDTNGAKIMNNEMAEIYIPLPSNQEQLRITAFLNHETANIDNLIEKQQQLIELLKEKRQAVISHAVTKGLNPDVPMKDSGVEWLGAIPRNWNCVAIKNICKIVNGSTPKSSIEEYWDGDIDWFTPTDLSHKETIQINDSLRKITNSGFLSCGTTMVPANTVILSSRAPIGSLAITKKSACTNQGCKSLVTFSAQLSKYIYYSLLIFNSPLNNLGRGSTFLELSTDDLGGFKISLPNDDIGEIIKYIDMTILKIDNLIEKQLQQIALLKERRTALISAAVTGKIDVRHWHAPDEQTTTEAEVAV